jgi:hypothetical protein
MDRYGKQNKIKGIGAGNNRDESALVVIKQKLMRHMKLKSWSLNDLYKIIDKNNTRSVRAVDF